MPTFVYQARKKTGEQVTGAQVAADQNSALEALRAQELFVTELKVGKNTPRDRTGGPEARSTSMAAASAASGNAAASRIATNEKVAAGLHVAPPPTRVAGAPTPLTAISRQPLLYANSKELSLFYRQMHAMLNAGTSLSHALQTMSEHAPNKALRKASAEMSRHLSYGEVWSAQMTAFPSLFSELAIGMVAAGENGGFLDRMCERLAEYCERDYELQQTIKRETAYPKLLVLCSILIPSAIPAVIAQVTTGTGFSTWLRYVTPPFLFLAMAFVGWRVASRSMPVLIAHGQPLRQTLDHLKLLLPVAGKTTRALAASKFCRALAALYSAGAGTGKMVEVAAKASGNVAFGNAVRGAIPEIQDGRGLTESLRRTGQFPAVALQMMQTGEASGRLDEQLDKVADFMEQDAETAIRQAVKVLGILAFLVVAIYVGSIVINSWVGTMTKMVDDGINLSN
jgi:type II secretory pathway component PulF